jgi:hypothetical protein
MVLLESKGYQPVSDHGTQLLRETNEGPANHRVEMLSLEAWVSEYSGLDPALVSRLASEGSSPAVLDPLDWLTIPQQNLLTLTAGEVFRDDDGRDRAVTPPARV